MIFAMNNVEHFFYCPYCQSRISMVLELMDEMQSYIEDCEVCCKPIQINFKSSESGEIDFFERRLDE